jgi:hypothetical protein|tara:strand:- start:276 stop:815 length:540 start_codon:yes stop_codon:yes gene_type:complete
MYQLIKLFSSFLILSLLFSCGGFKKVDTRKVPTNAQERAKINVAEGRGVSIKGILDRTKGSNNYEFSTANPMWRATLEILDFLPMTTVDYSGGMIITDWYADTSSSNKIEDSIKISIRFLSNEVRSDSLKVIIHKKICNTTSSCTVKILNNSTISEEIRTSIIKKAALLEKQAKNKKKK